MANVGILSAVVEEQPQYFEFTKNDIIGDCTGMAKLDYDPFPDKQLSDIVRTEIIARKLVLRARLKGDVLHIRPGVALRHEGREFTVIYANIQISTEEAKSISDIVAEAFLSPPEPLKALTSLRAILAADGRQRSEPI